MKLLSLCLLLCLSMGAYAACDHAVVEQDERFACVTIANQSDKQLVVAGMPGFLLNPGKREETMLLVDMAFNLQVTPNPYTPHKDLQLTCTIDTAQARKVTTMITYHKSFYDVNPPASVVHCRFE